MVHCGGGWRWIDLAAQRAMNFRSHLRGAAIRSGIVFRMDRIAQRILPKPQAVVVAMHETPLTMKHRFRAQLEWAAQRFTITSLERFAALWDADTQREAPFEKPLLLFTFDDGRESNYLVAAPLLEKFGGRGVFFVVPDFAECGDEVQALKFYRSRINPGARLEMEDSSSEDWKPMNPAQIADLAARGHSVGNHTLTHERLTGLSPERLQTEICASSLKLAAWTQKPIEAFAWTFGWNEIDGAAWNVIRAQHRFCFSPCAGAIDGRREQPSLLWRREIEVRYSEAELRFSYSGLVDLWWANRRKRLAERLRVRPA